MLKISAELQLPLDAVTGTFGILATKGAGKSNAGVVMSEEMWDAGVPWVAIDPKGDWYGIRSSADGKGPGLPIVVFGGRHGDVPLEPTAGALIADLVLDQRLTCVLDVSQFTKADVVRFLQAFGQRLFRHADDNGAEPLHLFLEEAHEYLPQQVTGQVAELVGTWQRIVKQGRFKGLGCTMISQRSSSLNKDVLELVDTLIVLRTIGPRSRDAIKAWVKDQDVDEKLLASLPTLKDGEAWVWSPGELHIMERIRFRRRRTFDSGATPKVGQTRRAPATLADVDLAAIKEQMADTIEKAKADDPKLLRKRIVDLERDLAAVRAQRPEPIVDRVEINVPVLDEQLVARLEEVLAGVSHIGHELGTAASAIEEQIAAARSVVSSPPDSRWKAPTPPAVHQSVGETSRRAPVVRRTAELLPDSEGRLGKRERAILSVLAQYPAGRTHRQLALLTGYSAKASTIGAGLSALRKVGYVEAGGSPIRATQAGVDALGEFEPLPSGPALLEYWLNEVGKRERLILEHLVAIYPGESDLTDMAAATGYSPDASTIGAGMSKLRGLELVERWHAHPDFMEAIS